MLYNKISNWIKDYAESNNMSSLIIGVSGGVDSAVSSTLAAKTGLKTIVVSMPIYQGEDQLKRANKHIDWLRNNYKNVESNEIDLTNLFDKFSELFSQQNGHALANTRSRLRMVTLYHIASLNNGLVVGTGNKVEDFGIGFYTKYGDGGVDISPIADLMKSEVFILAKYLNVIEDIQKSSPTDGLWDDDRTDEDQLGLSYEQLEDAMINENSVYREKYLEIRSKNIHKMNPIPICSIEDKIKNS